MYRPHVTSNQINPPLSLSYFMYPNQMVRGKALARCGLVLLSWWLCIQSVPIVVDKSEEKPHEENLEPPQSAVSQTSRDFSFKTDYCTENCLGLCGLGQSYFT